MVSTIYIYPFFSPLASHSLLAISANLEIRDASPPAAISPLAAAARPIVPGQVENTPDASFIPKVISPFSFLELEVTNTGIPREVPSAT